MLLSYTEECYILFCERAVESPEINTNFQSSNIPFCTKWCKPELHIIENILLINCVSSLVPKCKIIIKNKNHKVNSDQK